MQGSAPFVNFSEPLGLLDLPSQRLAQTVFAGTAERQNQTLQKGCERGGGQARSIAVVQLRKGVQLVQQLLHKGLVVIIAESSLGRLLSSVSISRGTPRKPSTSSIGMEVISLCVEQDTTDYTP